jgi:hypothetical protein
LAEFGNAFIAQATREVTLDSLHSIEPPSLALPAVDLHARYIEPLGTFETQWQSNVGSPTLVMRSGTRQVTATPYGNLWQFIALLAA